MIRLFSRFALLSILVMGLTLTVNAAPTAGITVTTAADTAADDSECSLREAIQAANSDSAVGGCAAGSGDDTITFAIPGAGPHIIQVTSALPVITTPIEIDGYTQSGAQPNTNPAPQGLNTILKIMLDGSQLSAPPIVAGLTITGGDSTVRGLAIGNFDIGIAINTNGSNTIAGNFIGTNISGTVAAPNAGHGISTTTSSTTIGYGFESVPANRNLISGNGGDGVLLEGDSTSFTDLNGNLIGTDLSATMALGNGGSGVSVLESPFATTIQENVIAANEAWGIRIENGSSSTTMASNLIGTNAQGDDLGNQADGILARNSGPQTIGGTYTAEGCCVGNTIAFNKGNGVSIRADINVSLEKGILSNRIYANGELGIDLGDDGVTLNDEGDADGENDANHLQNFPVLTAARVVTSNITITGTLNTITNTGYRIEFFANDACDPSGYGEGQRYLGAQRVTTDESGNVAFTVTLTETAPSVAQVGNQITALASDAAGNTSEFSRCIPATGDVEQTPEDDIFMPSLWGKIEEE